MIWRIENDSTPTVHNPALVERRRCSARWHEIDHGTLQHDSLRCLRSVVPHGERIREIERLDERRQHVKPRAVIPRREFDGFEMRSVREAAGVPSERFGAVIVSIEFVYADTVVGRGGNADHRRAGQQRDCQQKFEIGG